MVQLVLGLLAILLLAPVAIAYLRFQRGMQRAQDLFDSILASGEARAVHYDPTMLVGLPDIARRYFRYAIAPGTLLAGSVELSMSGSFILPRGMDFTMKARQALRPPRNFVWIASMRRGPLTIDGSDAFVDGAGWTRFWLMGLVPMVDAGGTPDFDRSAAVRPVMEAIWLPASLLPRAGAVWAETGPNTARVTLPTGPEPINFDLTLDADGRVISIETMRWSDSNTDRAFRLQLFRAESRGELSFSGYSIPAQLEVGYGKAGGRTVFFRAVIENAVFGR